MKFNKHTYSKTKTDFSILFKHVVLLKIKLTHQNHFFKVICFSNFIINMLTRFILNYKYIFFNVIHFFFLLILNLVFSYRLICNMF